MPPKGKKGNANTNKKEEERQDPLQAVLFCDAYETRFNPFTIEQPRCLLPLANTPLIEYTLEFLASVGVEEVYLYCGNHTDTVEEYLQKSKWTSNTSPFYLQVIRSNSRSVGDCMRDLMSKDLIVGDFISIYGDVVANIPLESALAAHRARREKDKKAIMTMVLREAGEVHRTKAQHLQPTFVLDSVTGRCVHYEQIRYGQNATLDIPGEVLTDCTELEIRADLIDCGIDICTPEVLAQYQDNFDWQLPRTGFLRGVLKDFETFQLTIHTHVASEGYAARVRNLQAYNAISKDVISRWAYPIAPDTNLVAGQSFQLYKGNVYREDGVVLSRSSVVGPRAALGKATSVGEHTTITNSVIGRRCVIGKRVKIDGAYIWDDVYIGDDTVINTAVIANEVSVGKKCNIEPGALLSYGVKIAAGITVTGDRRVSRLKRKPGLGKDDTVQAPNDPAVVGEDGVGYHVELDEDEEEVAKALLLGLQNMDLAVDDISTLDSDEKDDDEGSSLGHVRTNSQSRRSDSFASVDSDGSGMGSKAAADFNREAVNSLFDDLRLGSSPHTMQLELKALRLQSNATDKQVQKAVATAFSKWAANLVESGKSPKDAVAALIPGYNQLISSCVSTEEEQAEFLLFLQTDLTHRNQGEKLLLHLTTMMSTRKRKLDITIAADTLAATTATPSTKSEPQRKASKTSHHKDKEGVLVDAALPATPQTLASDKQMDSDDDFNSIASSQDLELNDADSSVDFGAADSDIDIEDFQDDDVAFDTKGADLKPQNRHFEVDHTVYSPQDIQAQQDRQVEEVANLLEQPHEATAILLRYGKWNKERLIEQYMDNQEEVLDKAGLGQEVRSHPPRIDTIDGFACDICCEDESGLESFAMRCGHRFCVNCYRQYLTQKIREEGEAARIKCPGDGCSNVVDAKSLELLIPSDLTDRYHELLMRTYVDDKDNLKWCPAPECVYAIECGVKKRDLNKVVPTVHCDCKHAFCFGCTLADHQPCPCGLVKKWLKKCEDDSETANWISANTKECPKCNSTIEKNGGCNHMTCRKCRNEFCWMCMGVWSEHGTSWYNCNRFEEKSGHDARDAQARSRQSLERYLHYYNRYANHEQSAKLDKDIYHKTEKKMQLLQNQSGLSWIEVQYLEEASKALQECRRTLKWTYAFAYYLARNNQTEIFEDNQKDLEMAVENLSEMFEKPTDALASLKVDMMDKTSYCMKRRIVLLDDTAENLKKGNWDFNVDLG
ncbi:E3 ubiquitin-protein ligase dbl4 [Fulvia fulva]|uniref:Mannose-1-phosphate guanyltransferase n=1 Tax=Passalora fulva TaxID=5499 RepID=A0A9Q8PFQ6_PASFU|nr:E3 ubiquitin-protein ligase dbl4 [Fulvia fulva]UJO21663.1 E3 ubiquitin-protein ligase dbl4 [Fulvia fulva]